MVWIEVSDELPQVKAGRYMVKTSLDEEFVCYFYNDKMQWIAFYGKRPCYWWNAKSHEPVFNVTHWWKDA